MVNPWLYQNLKSVGGRLRARWDWVVAVDGGEGTGKSTFAINDIARAMSDIMGVEFDPYKQIVYTAEELREAARNTGRYQVIVWDEAVEGAYKRQSQGRDRADLNKLFMQIRAESKFFILVIPNFWDLDKYFRNKRVKTWFHVRGRGIVKVRGKQASEFDKEPWWRLLGWVNFGPMRPEDLAIYEDIKFNAIRRVKDEEELGDSELSTLARGKMFARRKELGVSDSKMSEFFGVTKRQLYEDQKEYKKLDEATNGGGTE